MIDSETLYQWELDALDSDDPVELLEIIRHARRYLALRENEISIMQLAAQDFDHSAFRIEYDAAADRLLEGGE